MVIVFSPRRLREDMGRDGVRAAFGRMRARALAAGWPGLFLFIMGAARAGRAGLAALRDEAYDAATGYTYPRAGMADETALEAPEDRMVDGYEQIWHSTAASRVIDDVPVAEPGWDSWPRRGWHRDLTPADLGVTIPPAP